MSKSATSQAAAVLIETGRKIGDNLVVDPRMVEVSATVDRIQEALKARYQVWQTAVADEQVKRAQRDKAHQRMVGDARELGFMILSVTRNHHNVDLYLRYFPDGYGAVLRLTPEDAAECVRGILAALREETDPKIHSYRDRIEESFTGYVTAQAEFTEAVHNRKEAFAQLRNGKRDWGRGMTLARTQAEAACHYDHPYVRSIFAPLRRHRRAVKEEESEATETPATGQPPVPQAPSAPVTPVPPPA